MPPTARSRSPSPIRTRTRSKPLPEASALSPDRPRSTSRSPSPPAPTGLLPLGLHFTFALPAPARIEPGPYRAGRTFPGTVEPGASLFAIDREFPSLHAVPTRDGGTHDATAVPLPGRVEELVQLDDSDGTMALAVPDRGYRARISWDAGLLPSVNLWYSNRGRTAFPWNGRHLALGIEPICSSFGLSPLTARGANPVNAAGTPTARAFRAGERLTTTYRLTVEPL